MKVLQINIAYNEGSTGRIVYNIHTQLLGNGHFSMVIYGAGLNHNDRNIRKVASLNEWRLNGLYSKLSGLPYSGCYFSTLRTLKIIATYKPDVVHIHVINGYYINHYKLLKYLKDQKISTIITLHAEFMYTGKCGHSFDCNKWLTGCGNCPQKHLTPNSWFFDKTAFEWKRKEKIYNGFNDLMIVSVSPWLNDRARQSPFFKDKKLSVIGNGIDTINVFHPSSSDRLRKIHNIREGEKVILHVTASFTDPFKGGRYILELANSFLAENIRIIVLGDNGYVGDIPENVILLKHVKNKIELADYYSLADLTVITSRRETFSMVCAESLSCGTPVVGFKAGAPEQVALRDYSEFVDYGDIRSLIICIEKWIKLKPKIIAKLGNAAKSNYSKESMYNKYLNLYTKSRSSHLL
jgi:putative colanic acid biosynthesis glycosyltransferase